MSADLQMVYKPGLLHNHKLCYFYNIPEVLLGIETIGLAFDVERY